MLKSTMRPCTSAQRETADSLAAKYLRRGPGTGVEADIEEYDSDEEKQLRMQYAPGAPLNLKGKTLDLIPFLSNNGKTASLLRSPTQTVSFDVLRGKHILLCCVFLPLRDQLPQHWLSVIASLSTDFQMVLVPLTKTQSAADKALFLDFTFQYPVLAIPFSDIDTRHNICTFLGLKRSSLYRLVGCVVNPSGVILHHTSTFAHFLKYGSDFFPFVASHINSIDANDSVLRSRFDPFHRPEAFPRKRLSRFHPFYKEQLFIKPPALLEKRLSLHKDILQCHPSLVLHRFSPHDAPSLTVSQLSKKYVGLYICRELDFLHSLHHIYKACTRNGQELEIIVVCLPFFLDSATFTRSYQRRYPDAPNHWFSFPDDDKISRRLWRIFGRSALEDSFIIVPPDCVNGELLGRRFIEQGDKYPFTRTTVLEQRFTDFRSFTPSPTSWFEGADKKHTCLVRNDKKSNVRQSRVRGKKLLLYLDTPDLSWDDGRLFRRLKLSYPEIKAKGWEVVFIPFSRNYDGDPKIRRMPWPIMPASIVDHVLVIQQLFFPEEETEVENYLIAVDKDGKIVSRQAKARLKKHGVKECLFEDCLYQEFADSLSLIY